ncbi:MAG: tyrosine-type recombinase/integrase [Anaerolineaceae bacterium]|nr:tyrosine-type recombinase/integrase [Anaerolineaceae bacterium]
MTDDFSDIPHVNISTSLPVAMKFWQIYLADQEKSEYTIKAFLGDLNLLIQFLPPDITVGNITTSALNRFIEWLENGRGKNISCSPKSLSRRITTLKSFFRWLFEHGRINSDPAEKIIQHTVISPLPEVLTSNELRLVLEASNKIRHSEKQDTRPRALLMLLLETGIKKSECLNITRMHIETNENNYLFIRYADGRDRNKERKIALSEEFVEIYKEYLNQYDPDEKVFPWSPRRLEYILEDISTAAGINKHLSFSMCRWNCALSDWKNGVEKDAIRQKLGISKIQWREIKMKLQQLDKLSN